MENVLNIIFGFTYQNIKYCWSLNSPVFLGWSTAITAIIEAQQPIYDNNNPHLLAFNSSVPYSDLLSILKHIIVKQLLNLVVPLRTIPIVVGRGFGGDTRQCKGGEAP